MRAALFPVEVAIVFNLDVALTGDIFPNLIAKGSRIQHSSAVVNHDSIAVTAQVIAINDDLNVVAGKCHEISCVYT
jgi:hypothetical protein